MEPCCFCWWTNIMLWLLIMIFTCLGLCFHDAALNSKIQWSSGQPNGAVISMYLDKILSKALLYVIWNLFLSIILFIYQNCYLWMNCLNYMINIKLLIWCHHFVSNLNHNCRHYKLFKLPHHICKNGWWRFTDSINNAWKERHIYLAARQI